MAGAKRWVIGAATMAGGSEHRRETAAKLPSGLNFGTVSGCAIANWDRETKALQRETETVGWRRHDLRRNSATILGNLAALPDIVEAALNHVAIRSTLAATYNRARYLPQARDGLQWLGDPLDTVGSNSGAQIIPLRSRS